MDKRKKAHGREKRHDRTDKKDKIRGEGEGASGRKRKVIGQGGQQSVYWSDATRASLYIHTYLVYIQLDIGIMPGGAGLGARLLTPNTPYPYPDPVSIYPTWMLNNQRLTSTPDPPIPTAATWATENDRLRQGSSSGHAGAIGQRSNWEHTGLDRPLAISAVCLLALFCPGALPT
jgi:hypothetical protein